MKISDTEYTADQIKSGVQAVIDRAKKDVAALGDPVTNENVLRMLAAELFHIRSKILVIDIDDIKE